MGKKEPVKAPERPASKVLSSEETKLRCSTTDEELEALFSAIDKEITDDPDAALDLLDIIEGNPDDVTEEMQEEIEVIRSNIYLPPEEDYEMQVEEDEEDKEDEEMKEMMAMIESAKEEIDASKEDELLQIVDKLEDDEYFEKLKEEVKKPEKPLPFTVGRIIKDEEEEKMEDDTKKKTKDNKKKKAIAVGGVSLFGGKDLFGGKNPFASRKQEQSSEEEEEEDDNVSEEDTKPSSSTSNGVGPPPPPPLPSFNIAVQADSEEQPVSFEDTPSSTHIILSSNKHRAKLPSRRRPTTRANGHIHASNGQSNGDGEEANHSRLGLPSEDNDYDGDESEMSYQKIRRGRRSIKKKQPPRSSTMLSPLPHSRLSDSDDREIVHSKKCDPSEELEDDKRRKEEEMRKLEEEKIHLEKKKQEEERQRMEDERIKQEKELKRLEEERKAKEQRLKEEQELKRKGRERERRRSLKDKGKKNWKEEGGQRNLRDK